MLMVALSPLSMVSGAFATQPNMQDINVAPGHIITVNVNETFNITKETNSASTGYRLYPSFDDSYLTQVGTTYTQLNNSGCGTPVNQTFSFKAIKPGDTRILIISNRPWENCFTVVDSYLIRIN